MFELGDELVGAGELHLELVDLVVQHLVALKQLLPDLGRELQVLLLLLQNRDK